MLNLLLIANRIVLQLAGASSAAAFRCAVPKSNTGAYAEAQYQHTYDAGRGYNSEDDQFIHYSSISRSGVALCTTPVV